MIHFWWLKFDIWNEKMKLLLLVVGISIWKMCRGKSVCCWSWKEDEEFEACMSWNFFLSLISSLNSWRKSIFVTTRRHKIQQKKLLWKRLLWENSKTCESNHQMWVDNVNKVPEGRKKVFIDISFDIFFTIDVKACLKDFNWTCEELFSQELLNRGVWNTENYCFTPNTAHTFFIRKLYFIIWLQPSDVVFMIALCFPQLEL